MKDLRQERELRKEESPIGIWLTEEEMFNTCMFLLKWQTVLRSMSRLSGGLLKASAAFWYEMRYPLRQLSYSFVLLSRRCEESILDIKGSVTKKFLLTVLPVDTSRVFHESWQHNVCSFCRCNCYICLIASYFSSSSIIFSIDQVFEC